LNALYESFDSSAINGKNIKGDLSIPDSIVNLKKKKDFIKQKIEE
jgi:hypothetical protein